MLRSFTFGGNIIKQTQYLISNKNYSSICHQVKNSFILSSQNASRQILTKKEHLHLNHTTLKEIGSVVVKDSDLLEINFGNEDVCNYSFVWLRDNCQCALCFDASSQARQVLLEDVPIDTKPKEIKVDGTSMTVVWDDGHKSNYDSKWIYERSHKNIINRHRYQTLKKVPWGANAKIEEYEYCHLRDDDSKLLDFLVCMEKMGVAIIRNAPEENITAGQDLVKHIAFPKRTHYGDHSPIYAREVSNNLAFTPRNLGLHVDLPFYNYMPGLIFLHMVHNGNAGGESVVSDSLYTINYLKQNDPEAFEILTTTKVFFWDMGKGNIETESEEFYKIQNRPIVEFDKDGNFVSCGHNNQVRDSYLDIPANRTKKFYRALQKFHQTLYDNAFEMRLGNGEMIVLDNTRCLHGRKAYKPTERRFLDNIYLDWDEAKCKRRTLQKKINQFHIE